MTIDLGQRQRDGRWARYLPAISGFYTTHLGKAAIDPTFIPESRIPKTFEYGLQGLNFLDLLNSYYHYPYALYSAGHAERNLTKCNNKEPMIHGRDKEKTIIVGDSGGYQIAKGVIKLDWKTVMTSAGDKLREEILRYLEYTADWSMTLDVPAFAALPPLSEKTGLKSFQECLDVSEYNLQYFLKNRKPGATKFLNVLSGSSAETSKEWYERVKPYSIPEVVEEMGYSADRAFEGWAFAGINMCNMKVTLERLIDLREDGLLESKDWIHFLGIGRLDWACYLTSIERQLKKYNPNLSISYDAASPFVAAGGYALSYDYNYFTPDQLTYSMGKGLDNRNLKGSNLSMPFQGPIMERCTVGDICVLGPNDTNKHGKLGKTSWDTTSYAIVMAHNVYNHIHAVQEINRLADIEYATKIIDYTDWAKSKSKTPISNFVPNNILFFNSFVKELFSRDRDGAYQLLNNYKGHLDKISFRENKIVDTFHTLFDHSNVNTKKKIEGQDIASIDNEDLINIDE